MICWSHPHRSEALRPDECLLPLIMSSTSSSPSSTNDNTASEAAAAASSMRVDEYYALTIQALDQLTTIFSFPKGLAQKAIEECGPEDVQVRTLFVCYSIACVMFVEIVPVFAAIACGHTSIQCKIHLTNHNQNSQLTDFVTDVLQLDPRPSSQPRSRRTHHSQKRLPSSLLY